MFGLATPHFIKLMKDLRRQVYTLSYAGESEAIGQALGYKTTYNLPATKVVQKANSETFTGGNVEDRVQLAINRLVRRIMNVIELAAVNEEEQYNFDRKLNAALPKARTVSTEQRNVTVGPKLREAEQIGPKEDMSVGFIDDETWDELVDTYKEEYVPSWRGPESSYTVKTASGEKETLYSWELEQEVTQDFVYQVRTGQIDAAKENGINDYVWVAVVDSRTDDCCLWRDGLTTAEIERRLKTDRADDNCQSIVPPAHFNCRCVLAPMVEEMPEAPDENTKDFESWLNT
jgi:SPP1 gp7 family putative phage head morphogenesis protein